MGIKDAEHWEGWLLHEGRVLASLEVPVSFRRRCKGLLGREKFDGALYLEGANSVHSMGMKFPLDIVFVDKDMVISEVLRLEPNRFVRPRLGVSGAFEVSAGAFALWGVSVGDQLAIRGGEA